MTARRSFLAYAVGMLAAMPVLAQKKAIVENGKAVVCDSDSIICPNGHQTCLSIDAPVVVGNGSYQNPDVGQLNSFHMERCEVCHVLFTKE